VVFISPGVMRSGCPSVLKTQLFRDKRSSSLKSRYKYFRVSAMKNDGIESPWAGASELASTRTVKAKSVLHLRGLYQRET